MKSVLLAVLTGLCAQAARADVVTLKNGDRVTGKLIRVKGGNLSLKSDMMGDLTIAMDKVTSFSVEQPATVVVKGKTPVEGQLQLEPSGDWQVVAKAQTQTVTADSVDVIMPASDYQRLAEHTAEPWQDWKGSASLGYGLQQGNQNTRTFTTTISTVRERPEAPIFTPHWRTNFDLTTLLSSSTENNVFVDSRTLSAAFLSAAIPVHPRQFCFWSCPVRPHLGPGIVSAADLRRWLRARPHQELAHRFQRARRTYVHSREVLQRRLG